MDSGDETVETDLETENQDEDFEKEREEVI